MITAHSGGCRVRLSAGEAVEISANDVASLHLSKKPFVIVRACNGNEAGFAKAFITAGARGVWVNQGKILASEVNSQLREFLTASKQKTIAQAMRQSNREARKQLTPQVFTSNLYCRRFTMHQTISSGNPGALFKASDSELMALLGLQALPLLKKPDELLAMGRSGELYGDREQLGEGEFEHSALAQVGKAFLRKWAVELQKAICTKGELYKKLRQKGSAQTDILVAVAVGRVSLGNTRARSFFRIADRLGSPISKDRR